MNGFQALSMVFAVAFAAGAGLTAGAGFIVLTWAYAERKR